MSSYVVTLLEARPEVLRALYRPETAEELYRLNHKYDDQLADWERKGVTPPDWMLVTHPEGRIVADFNTVVPEPVDIETNDCSGVHEPGVVCWREWRLENWGTRSNCCSETSDFEECDSGVIRLETTASHPLPVITTLSRMFPEDDLSVDYAHEELGFHVGHYVMRGGVITSEDAPVPGSDKAVEMASRIYLNMDYDEWLSYQEADDEDGDADR